MDAPNNQEIILSGQQALAGLIGSVIMVLRDPRKRSRVQQISAVLAGTASAVYLTEPVVSLVIKDIDAKHLLGFSFLFGCLGMRLIEILIDKIEHFIIEKLDVNK